MATPEEMAASMLKNLPEKTGKTLEQWQAILADAKLEKHGQMVSYLKKEHGVTHGFANLIVAKFRDQDAGNAEIDLVRAQYSGPKAALKPIYDALIKTVSAFGPDVEIAPKKAYVSLRRKKQFAIIQPSTKTRVDVGLNLKGTEPTDRLEASGSFNAMVSHRVRVESPGDIDQTLSDWLKQAWESAQ